MTIMLLHLKNKMVQTKGLLWIVIPAVFCSLSGSFFALSISGTFLKRAFGLFLILLAIFQLFSDKIITFFKIQIIWHKRRVINCASTIFVYSSYSPVFMHYIEIFPTFLHYFTFDFNAHKFTLPFNNSLNEHIEFIDIIY